jgi:shikimate kinase
MIVIFIGMKHCGKSTHGRAFAESRQWDFVDTDEELLETYNLEHDTALDIRGLFNRVGEDTFARLEEELMARLLRLDGDLVVSMGGRMPVNDRIQGMLQGFGFKVYLKLAPEVLFERVRRRGLPSFIDPARPLESFTELYRQREPYYLRCADLVIQLDDLPRDAARRIIFHKIEEKLHAR